MCIILVLENAYIWLPSGVITPSDATSILLGILQLWMVIVMGTLGNVVTDGSLKFMCTRASAWR